MGLDNQLKNIPLFIDSTKTNVNNIKTCFAEIFTIPI